MIAQGIFENYIREARAKAQALAGQPPHEASCGHIDEMVVSSNHNESSPDTVGIYGASGPDRRRSGSTRGSTSTTWTGSTSRWRRSRSTPATTAGRPSLREVEFPVPPGIRQEIPNRFPTTDDCGSPAAIDPKVRVLQARDASGDPIFTMMNLADHNQDIGHSDTYEESHAVSGDWPGYFHRRLEQDRSHGGQGMAMFLAGDIGSMEDLITDPAIPDPPCNSGANGCFAQVELTGETRSPTTSPLSSTRARGPSGPARSTVERTEFCAPLENKLFRAAFEAGLFGERQGYTNCQSTPERSATS